MRRVGSLLTVACMLVFLSSGATAAGGNFISREQVDLVKLLAPPPAADSPQTTTELEEIAQIQHQATPQALLAAKADAEESIFQLADLLGPRFTSGNLPITTKFFSRLGEDADYIVSPAKEAWKRPRPFRLSAEIKPCVWLLPISSAYPSGHATFGYVSAIVLANMLPEKKAEIFDRALQYGHNRVVCGVHFPSDVEAGKIAGTVIAAFVLQNPAFQEDYAKARAEVRKVLGYD
jgi:acid phosphatase (class A)